MSARFDTVKPVRSRQDHQMIQWAAVRGRVIVETPYGPRLARLVRWRAARSISTARVRFLSGQERTVKCDQVRIFGATEAN